MQWTWIWFTWDLNNECLQFNFLAWYQVFYIKNINTLQVNFNLCVIESYLGGDSLIQIILNSCSKRHAFISSSEQGFSVFSSSLLKETCWLLFMRERMNEVEITLKTASKTDTLNESHQELRKNQESQKIHNIQRGFWSVPELDGESKWQGERRNNWLTVYSRDAGA